MGSRRSLFQRIIHGLPQIELFDLRNQCRIIRRLQDFFVLEKIENASSRDQVCDFRIVSQGHDFGMFAQLSRPGESKKTFRIFRISKQLTHLCQRVISFFGD